MPLIIKSHRKETSYKMTNKDFVKKLSKKFRVSQRSLIKYLDIIELGLKEELKNSENGQKLKVLDFTFEIKTTKEKIMRNPKTNEKVLVNPKKKLRIIQSSDWKRIFNGF